MNGIASSSSTVQLPILRKQQKHSCRTSLVIALSAVAFGRHDLQILRHHTFFFCGGFLNQRVYSNNPRSLEDLEHIIEWAFAGTYYKILETLHTKINFRRANACLKVWDIFIFCSNHIYMPHSWLPLKKIK